MPPDLSIGKQKVNWLNDAAVSGTYESSGNALDKIPGGKIHALLHQSGILIAGAFLLPIVPIHKSQIVTVEQIFEKDVQDKSVIGRAILGNVVFGPLGAIIGGMSGIGTKLKYKSYLAINYWDVSTKKLQTITIGCDSNCTAFIKRYQKEFV